ncbi:MAG: hypothetical protein SFY69_04040 [Planctomycetota bacterium]|nr:hypothetical protein [Planctomycetota bacterium]
MRGMRVAAAVVALGAGTASGQTLYGVSNFGNFRTQVLVQIDTTTGAATPVGDTGLERIADIAYDRGMGVMYALTTGADLYTLDLATGASTLVASNTGVLPEGGLTFDASMGRLLANSSTDLLGVHTATAARTTIGAFNTTDTDVSGLAFDASGRLLGLAKNGTLSDTLLSIDLSTGQATLVGDTGVSSAASVGGLAFYDGTLFMSDGGALWSLDAATGAATYIGAHGVVAVTDVSGIAFIPAPGAGALLALAGVVVSRRRRA